MPASIAGVTRKLPRAEQVDRQRAKAGGVAELGERPRHAQRIELLREPALARDDDVRREPHPIQQAQRVNEAHLRATERGELLRDEDGLRAARFGTGFSHGQKFHWQANFEDASREKA